MTNVLSRKLLVPNQQTYQRLKLSLSLNLRRQIFIAVCDDLMARDRFAAQLQAELNQSLPEPESYAEGQRDGTDAESFLSYPLLSSYPRLVSLQLNLEDPNPLMQMAQWLNQSPPPVIDGQQAPMPAFQILGIEHLTRQAPAIQRLFFTHLQSIERNLPLLDFSILLWTTQPWFHSLSQSASDFWRCRTGVFEFAGDPTPLVPPSPKALTVKAVSAPSSRLGEFVSPGAPPPATKKPRQLVAIAPSPADSAAPPPSSPPVAPPPVLKPEKIQENPWLKFAESLELLDELDQLYETEQVQTFLEEPPTARANPAPVSPATDRPSPAQTDIPPAAAPIQIPAEWLAGQEQAIALVHQIERLHQQRAHPEQLAEAYLSLGNFYRDRIEQGEAAPQNLAIAIQAYEHVLQWLAASSPLAIDVLNDLGNLYWMLSRSIPDLSIALPYLQQGVQAYQRALARVNPTEHTLTYAMVQNNLGAAYAALANHTEPVENLELSVHAYREALRYRHPEVDPFRYASTQNNLGTTYWNLAQHKEATTNLKQAIAAYSEALDYYNPEQDPLNYAMMQNNLGTAYWNLAQHERPYDWMRLAMSAYQIALTYRTLEAAPAAHAATQNNLGTAYWHMAQHVDDPTDRVRYLQQAVGAYEATIRTVDYLQQRYPESFAAMLNFDRFATHNNLGLAHYYMATDALSPLDTYAQMNHIEAALEHHVIALQGWEQTPNLRQTALNCILQAVRAAYNQMGLPGQNLAIAKLPGSLLAEVLPKL